MNLLEIAQIYTELVNLDEEIPEAEIQAKDEIYALRTKYHEMFMEKLREENIEFFDRFDAARKAFDLIKTNANRLGVKSVVE